MHRSLPTFVDAAERVAERQHKTGLHNSVTRASISLRVKPDLGRAATKRSTILVRARWPWARTTSSNPAQASSWDGVGDGGGGGGGGSWVCDCPSRPRPTPTAPFLVIEGQWGGASGAICEDHLAFCVRNRTA